MSIIFTTGMAIEMLKRKGLGVEKDVSDRYSVKYGDNYYLLLGSGIRKLGAEVRKKPDLGELDLLRLLKQLML